MFGKTLKGLVQLFGGLGAGVAIIALLVAWQLHKGPVSLAFLTPYVEQALNANHRSFQLAIEDTTLTWAGWDRAVELRVKNVRAIGEDEQTVARIPELSLSLSGAALIRGQLAPKYIEFLGPELRVSRGDDGDIDVELIAQEDKADGKIAEGLISWLLRRPEPGTPMSYLETVSVSGATMTFLDQATGKRWQVPVGYVRLDRAAHGLLASGSVLIDVDGRIADVTLNGAYRSATERLDISATFSEIAPAAFAGIDGRLSDLAVVDLPLSGTLIVGMTMKDGVDTVGFNVKGGAGELTLPAPLTQQVEIESATVRGLYNKKTQRVSIDAFELIAPKGTRVTIPEPVSHTYVVHRLTGALTYDVGAGALDVAGLEVISDGPTLSVDGRVTGLDGGSIDVIADAALTSVATARLADYWPAALGSNPRTWALAHLSKGQMDDATASVAFRIDPTGAVELRALSGTMSASNVEVTYLDGMPLVFGSKASMTFDENNFNIYVEQAHSAKVTIAGGTVAISGLQDVDQYADIDLRGEAALPDILRLIDNKPLEFASAMGIKPSNSKGRAEVELQLRFILEKDLKLEDLDIAANAKLISVAMEDVVLGRGIRDGKMSLKVDKSGMDITGNVKMGAIPVNLTWRENFTDGAPYTARYEMAAPIDNIRSVSDLGVHPPEIALDAVSGGLDAELVYTVFDRRTSRLEVRTNLSRAEIDVPELDWHKSSGEPGRAEVTILIENGLIKRVPSFDVMAGDLFLRGDVVYSPGGLGLERVNLARVLFGRSDVSGAVIARADGTWEVGLQGKTLDLTPIWHHVIGDRPARDDIDMPNITLALEVGKVFVDKERFMSNLSATLVHKDDIWRTVLIDSQLNGGTPLTIRMAPDDVSGNRVLSVKADDAGETLRFLDLFGNMYGGVLEIRGTYEDAAPARPLKGEMRVADYRIRNAPLMTRILSIMSLTGIVDAMTGEGLAFSSLEVPFTKTEGEVTIMDAKATGTSIGFTASGSVYTQADVLNIEGTVVPAYAINSFFGKIPLLGNLLAGRESGGGVFAANFSVSGPMEDPKTSVNPLSALTPGILRNLFGAFKPDEPVLLGDPNEQLLPGAPGN